MRHPESPSLSPVVPRRWLVLSHDADRSGAPLALLWLLEWLHARFPEIALDIVLLRNGPLRESFAQLGTVTVVEAAEPTTYPMFVGRAARWLRKSRKAFRIERIRSRLRSGGYERVFANSAYVAELVAPLTATHSVPLDWWIHECETTLSVAPAFLEVWARARSFVAASQAVARSLESLGVPDARVNVCRVPLPPDRIVTVERSLARSALRSALSVNGEAKVVLFCGRRNHGKGFDLLPQIARRICGAGANYHLLWLGGADGEAATSFVRRDLEKLGLTGAVSILPSRTDPGPVFAGCDLFLLPSRLDSYPIVLLEAALAELPSVCFQGAGGAPEFAALAGGAVVPYLDVHAMAEAALSFLQDESLRGEAGRLARAQCIELHASERAFRAFAATAFGLNELRDVSGGTPRGAAVPAGSVGRGERGPTPPPGP